MSKRSNWDIHYNNRIRIFTTFIGLKGNFVLNKNIKNFIFKNSNGFNKILEIGAGSGRLSALVSKYFNQCDLIDKSSSALKLAAIISKKSRPIIIDIFDYSENEKYDVVVSVGLVEHFEKNKMQKLIEKHLKLAKQNGCVIIVVPAYSADREMLVKTPSMNKKYGFQDAKAEFKVEGYFIKRNISFDKIRRIKRNYDTR